MGINGCFDESCSYLASPCISKIHIDRKQILARKEYNLLPVGAEGRRNIQSILFCAFKQQAARFIGHVCQLSKRAVSILHGIVPAFGKLLQRDSEDFLDNWFIIAGFADCLHDFCYCCVSPSSRDIGPERLTISIREILRIIQLLNCGKLFSASYITHPHSSVGIYGPNREILSKTFNEPERKSESCGRSIGIARAILGSYVKLESVNKLVAYHMIGFS